MSYHFSNDHSFATDGTFPGLHTPSTTFGFGQDQIFPNISHVPSAAQVLQACDIVQTLPQETTLQLVEHHRYDSKESTYDQVDLKLRGIVASSTPEHLPHPENCLPESSTNSWTENNLLQAKFERPHHFGGRPGHSGTDVYTPARPPPNSLTAPDTWHVCMACDRSYANSGALGKHQRTVCERTHSWICLHCQHQVFEKPSELDQHHRSVHGNTCEDCYNLEQLSPSDHCKAFLSRCSVKTAKKAWGCPCCIDCFNTLEDWNNHKISHQVHNEKVVNWSFSTMVRSLLRHRDLLAASDKYDWSRCSWAYMGKNQYQTLRFALERHVIPSTMFDTETYSRLGMLESLVLNTFRLGMARDTSVAPLDVFGRQTAINAYSNVSMDQSPGFQATDLDFQPLKDIGRGNTFKSDQSQHGTPNTFDLAPDEAENHEELASFDITSLKIRRAAGDFQTWLLNDQGRFSREQGLAPFASFPPSPNSGVLVISQVQQRRKAAKDRLTRRRKYAKQDA